VTGRSKHSIAPQVAGHLARRLSRRAIEELQGMTGVRESGANPGLESAWAEVCVQIRQEQSARWKLDAEIMEGILLGLGDESPKHEQEARWLVANRGGERNCEADELRELDPLLYLDIIQPIRNKHHRLEAGRWPNPRILTCMERASAID
jgi:hypothetical protein